MTQTRTMAEEFVNCMLYRKSARLPWIPQQIFAKIQNIGTRKGREQIEEGSRPAEYFGHFLDGSIAGWLSQHHKTQAWVVTQPARRKPK